MTNKERMESMTSKERMAYNNKRRQERAAAKMNVQTDLGTELHIQRLEDRVQTLGSIVNRLQSTERPEPAEIRGLAGCHTGLSLNQGSGHTLPLPIPSQPSSPTEFAFKRCFDTCARLDAVVDSFLMRVRFVMASVPSADNNRTQAVAAGGSDIVCSLNSVSDRLQGAIDRLDAALAALEI